MMMSQPRYDLHTYKLAKLFSVANPNFIVDILYNDPLSATMVMVSACAIY